MSPMTLALGATGLLLVISMAGNALLFRSRDAALEEKATAETALAGWKSSAETCSASVDKLAADGKKRHQELLAALGNEAARIKGLQHDALSALSARPDDAKDLCGSVQRYLQGQIRAEKGAK